MMIGSDHDSGNVNSITERMIDADQTSNAHTTTFPFRLYQMLEEADNGGFGDIVSWLPDGNGFIVHDREQFTSHVMKTFFSHTKWKSFLRQLNLYNFERLSKRGPGQGSCYSHPCLIRGEIEQCKLIHRSTTTGGAAIKVITPSTTTHAPVFDKSFMEDMYFRQKNNKDRATMRNLPSKIYHSPSSGEVDLKGGISSFTLFHSIIDRPFFNHEGKVGLGVDTNTDTQTLKNRAASHDDGMLSSHDRVMPIIDNQHDSTKILFPLIRQQELVLLRGDHDHQDDPGGHRKENEAVLSTVNTFKSRSSPPVEAVTTSNIKNHYSQHHQEAVEDEEAMLLDQHHDDESNKHAEHHHDRKYHDTTTHQFSCQYQQSCGGGDSSSVQQEASILLCATSRRKLLLSCSPNPIGSKNIIACASTSQVFDWQSRLLLVKCSATTFPDDIADAIVSIFGCRP